MGVNPTPGNKPISELPPHYQAKDVAAKMAKIPQKIFEQPVALLKTSWGWCMSPPGDQFITGSLRAFGVYSDTELAILLSIRPKTADVLVVGANVGTIAVPLAMRYNSVTAYEPQPLIAMLCQANAIINNVEHKLFVRNAAIGPKAGMIKVPVVNMGAICNMGMVGKSDWGQGVDIKMEDIAVELRNNYNLIILDVEGMEVEILEAVKPWVVTMRELKLHRKLPILWVECDRGGEHQDNTIGLIREIGYRPFWCITPLCSRDVDINNEAVNPFGVQCSFNLLCMPNNEDSPITGLREAFINQPEAGPGCSPEWITWQLG
jgi:FkbM family methyltransferase